MVLFIVLSTLSLTFESVSVLLTLDVPFSRTDVFKNSFFIRICRLWNELPLSIRESTSLSIFRKNLLAFYYDKFNVDFF